MNSMVLQKTEEALINNLQTNKNHILGDGLNKYRGIIKVENKVFSYSGAMNKRQTAK